MLDVVRWTRERISVGAAATLGLALALLLPAVPSRATQIGFDEIAIGTGVAGQPFDGVSILSGVVIDDPHLMALTGDSGPWATSGDRGLVNVTDSAIQFEFAAPIESFEIDVISLPNSTQALLPLLLLAYVDEGPLTNVVSNSVPEVPFALSSGSAVAETLSIFDSSGRITRVVLFPRVPCSLVACEGEQNVSDVYLDVPASFFADSVSFVVPEPGTLPLLAAGLACLGLARRRRRAGPRRAAAVLLLGPALWLTSCIPVEVLITNPADDSTVIFDPDDPSPMLLVEIHLGEELAPGGSLHVTLLAGGDAAAGTFSDVTGSFVVADDEATADLDGALLVEGSNTLFASVDRDGDGLADVLVTSTFQLKIGSGHTIAREWNELLLDAIRVDTPRPTVHARNLFHLSVAMWDCWVAYDQVTDAVGYFLNEKYPAADANAARHECISHAAYRILKHRFVGSIGAATSLPTFDAKMDELGYDKTFFPVAGDTSPAAAGIAVAFNVIFHGVSDGANEQQDYFDPSYLPYNDPLIFKLPGTQGSIIDPNRWSPLTFDFACFQNSIPIPDGATTQVFVGSHWNAVTPFALTRDDPSLPYFDPGAPPLAAHFNPVTELINGVGELEFKEQMLEVVRYSSRLDPDDAPMINISPGVYGNNSLAGLAAYTFDGTGYPVNPHTGLPYPANWVNEADYGRVIAEFWADGPDSETPPGHWNTLFHYVTDHPLVEKRIGGVGPLVDDLEWDVKGLNAINGAVHDAAIAAWGAKAIYDYVRPIAGIRWLAENGQSSDPARGNYSRHGMLLEDGLVELITPTSVQPGERHHHLFRDLGKVAFKVWPGEPNRELPPECGEDPPEPDPDLEIPPYSGTEWITGENWITYQRRTFVVPPFAAYISGHSTFSRAAAVVLHRFTGDPYFPGGFGEFVAPQNDFLVFENGPNQTVHLRWATYYDAADEAGISRLWGGIHVAADDFEGRVVGEEVGHAAYELAEQYWNGTLAP